jgi:hypothetical protein
MNTGLQREDRQVRGEYWVIERTYMSERHGRSQTEIRQVISAGSSHRGTILTDQMCMEAHRERL